MKPLRQVSLKDGIIYGPVASRRLGRSLGINVLGAARKVCTFDCAYCQLRQPRRYPVDDEAGRALCRRRCASCAYAHPDNERDPAEHALPSVGRILDAVEAAVLANPGLESLTLSGNGEPTAYPCFAELITGLRELRDRGCPGTPITVLSNSSTLWRPSVRKALRDVDVRVMKLDAGDEATFSRVNRPCPGTSLEAVVEGLRELGDVTVQTLFVDGPAGNTRPAQIESWLAVLARVGPRRLQVHSLDRVPADSALVAVARDRLETIAREAVARTGAEVGVY